MGKGRYVSNIQSFKHIKRKGIATHASAGDSEYTESYQVYTVEPTCWFSITALCVLQAARALLILLSACPGRVYQVIVKWPRGNRRGIDSGMHCPKRSQVCMFFSFTTNILTSGSNISSNDGTPPIALSSFLLCTSAIQLHLHASPRPLHPLLCHRSPQP